MISILVTIHHPARIDRLARDAGGYRWHSEAVATRPPTAIAAPAAAPKAGQPRVTARLIPFPGRRR